jgi:hypothetical protein
VRRPTPGTNDARLSDARAPLAHSHTEANVTNLTSDLAAKAPAAHNHDASYATTGHTHAGSQAFPVGALYLSVTNTNPATSLGYGTWSQVAQGLLLIGQTGAQTGGQQVGNATHAHAFTQPSDHAALTMPGRRSAATSSPSPPRIPITRSCRTRLTRARRSRTTPMS